MEDDSPHYNDEQVTAASQENVVRWVLLASLLLAIAPLLVAAPIVAGGALLVGLPFTAWLARHDRESAVAYIAGGLVAGAAFAALLVFVIDVRDGYWLAGLGAASGGVTGWTWWASARRPDAR